MGNKVVPNPRNCYTCDFGADHSHPDRMVCLIPHPKWLGGPPTVEVTNPQDKCETFKPSKGTFARICLNCGKPVRTHHKYTKLGENQWIHKFCDHPESQSRFHYEKYHKSRND